MGVRFYDEALVNKIKSWVKDKEMRILSPENVDKLFQIKANDSGDKALTLPLIAISRKPVFEILSTNKKPLTFDGKLINANEAKSMSLNAIPIRISYQLDIYTKRFDEADDYVRNFIFNFINYPKLTITIPYNDANIEHDSNVRILSNVVDSSDIPNRIFQGQFTRWTLNLEIDDAYLFSVPFNANVKVDVDDSIEIKEKRDA